MRQLRDSELLKQEDPLEEVAEQQRERNVAKAMKPTSSKNVARVELAKDDEATRLVREMIVKDSPKLMELTNSSEG